MTDFIETLKKAGGRIGVFPIGENAWIDTGEWTEYRKALRQPRRLGTRDCRMSKTTHRSC